MNQRAILMQRSLIDITEVPMFEYLKLGLVAISAIALIDSHVVAGNHPQPLRSRRDVESCSTSVEDIDIRELPVQHYPLLAKFAKLKRIRLANYESRKGVGGTDEKLKALSSLQLTNVIDITLLNS